jgi:membrane-associated protein
MFGFDWLHPEKILEYGGLGLLLAMIFAESGLLLGIFLPGDTLLITAGLLCNTHILDVHVGWLLALVNLASITGYITAYFIGLNSRELLLRGHAMRRFRFYIEKTLELQQRQGMRVFFLPRFLPFIRTFIPIVAGMSSMKFSTFLMLNIIGSTLWTSFFILGGYTLGRLLPAAVTSLEWVVLAVIVLVLVPLFKQLLHRRTHR